MKNNFKVGDVVKRVSCEGSTVGELVGMLSIGDQGIIKDLDSEFIQVSGNTGNLLFWYDHKHFELVDSSQQNKQECLRVGDFVYLTSTARVKTKDVELVINEGCMGTILEIKSNRYALVYFSGETQDGKSIERWVPIMKLDPVKKTQQNCTWDDITMPSFPLHNEDQTHTNETLEKSPEDPVKLHENKLREEVKQHRDEIEKDTRGAYQFFLNNEDDIIYKLKMSNRPVNKSELIKYHQSIFPKLDEKLFGRMLLRKGFIFSTPRDKYGQPFGVIDWIFWFVIILLVCILVLASLVVIL